jgi:hypothetical protein
VSDTELEANDNAPVRPPRKRGLLAFFLWLAGLLVGLPVLAGLCLLLWSALAVSDPVARIPPGSRPTRAFPPRSPSSAAPWTQGPGRGPFLSGPRPGPRLVRTLRAAPILRSKTFETLADLRLDAAL